MSVLEHRDPRAEAQLRAGRDLVARVLEPSPPAVNRPPYVDDPAARGDVPDTARVVSPVGSGDLLWDELVADDPSLAEFCAARWLGAYRRLEAPPTGLQDARRALHGLAEHVISPTRRRDHGEITLRWTLGGFGTPFFGADAQLRVVGDIFVVQTRGGVQKGRLTTLGSAAEFVGYDLVRTEHLLGSESLAFDPAAGLYLGEVFGFATSVLSELRAEAQAGGQPSFVNLWPEHFDVAVELGVEASGHRAAFGISPGDADHAEPYVYVAPWEPQPADAALWNATAFAGAELSWAAVLAAPDQRACALSFLRERRDALAGR